MLGDDFDAEFESIQRKIRRAQRWALPLVLLGGLVSLGVLGLVVWVVMHFVLKFW